MSFLYGIFQNFHFVLCSEKLDVFAKWEKKTKKHKVVPVKISYES